MGSLRATARRILHSFSQAAAAPPPDANSATLRRLELEIAAANAEIAFLRNSLAGLRDEFHALTEDIADIRTLAGAIDSAAALLRHLRREETGLADRIDELQRRIDHNAAS